MILPAPMPSDADMNAAQGSAAERRRVDLMYARACGMDEDTFLAYLEEYDLLERARRISEAEVAIDRAKLDADLADFWIRNPVTEARPALRLVKATRRPSRKRPQRSDAA